VTGDDEIFDLENLRAEAERRRPQESPTSSSDEIFDLDNLRAEAERRARQPLISPTPFGVIDPPIVTGGKWATEAEAAADLDRRLDKYRTLFHVYRECRGELVQRRYGQQDRAVRIDRILTPGRALLDAGWTFGAIGVEIKRSGEKIGPPVAQMSDYVRCLWEIGPGRIKVQLDWVFLWPLEKQHGNAASWMAQNRLGSAWATFWHPLSFHSGESRVLCVGRDGRIVIGSCNTGLRTGSR
jgi:hypothetical protein